MFGTTKEFLDDLGLGSLAALPPLQEGIGDASLELELQPTGASDVTSEQATPPIFKPLSAAVEPSRSQTVLLPMS